MKLNVLIVDDDEIICFLHEMMIRKSGLSEEPLKFLNGRAALEYLEQNMHTDEQYLVFLDINMPVMNGWDFLAAVSGLRLKLFVVMVTSSVDSADRLDAENYDQVVGFVTKPLNLEQCGQFREIFN